MLKSRSMWPPGGWAFLQPETGWRAPSGLSFDQVVNAIIDHRQRNPRFKLATDKATVANELDNYTCAILKNNSHWCATESIANFSKPLPVKRHQAGAKGSVAGASKFLENAKAGIKLWMEWFGDGKLVDKEVATKRAGVCVTCPKNPPSNLIDKFTSIVVNQVKSIFESLNDLNMKTDLDDKLNVCVACDCPLRAKVWTPLSIITRHLAQSAMESLNTESPRCWILTESEINK